MLEYIIMKLTQKHILFSLSSYDDYLSIGFHINNKLMIINIKFNENRIRYYLVNNKISQISKKELKELIDTILT